MNPTRTVILLAILAVPGIAAAEAIMISPAQVKNLGIRFESPQPVSEVVATEATARVVIPPEGDAVIGVPEAGLLTALNVDVGDEVARGDVVAEVRSPDFIAMQRELLDALNTHRLAQNELARDRQLHDEGIISARRLQETTTRSRIAETSLNEHRQLLKIAGLTEDDMLSLESAQALIESLRVRAPIDGVVVERMATTGQRLDAMAPVYRLADLSELWLQIHVPQEQVPAVTPGMTVKGAGGSFAASIVTIGKAVDPATQSVIVRARVTDGIDRLRPGQFVAVRLVELQRSPGGAWMVPVSAITRSGDANFMFLERDGGVEVRRVDVLSVDGERAFLDTALDAGDRVAVSGISVLKSMWSSQVDGAT